MLTQDCAIDRSGRYIGPKTNRYKAITDTIWVISVHFWVDISVWPDISAQKRIDIGLFGKVTKPKRYDMGHIGSYRTILQYRLTQDLFEVSYIVLGLRLVSITAHLMTKDVSKVY